MASETRYTERMSESDAIMWKIESDPALRSTIVGIWVMQGAPNRDRFTRKLERCVREIPRLRQRPVTDPLGLAPPAWEDDPNFDLSFHVRRVAAPGDGSVRALLDLAQPIGMQAFDRDRPLWELDIVEGLEGGRTGVIMKLHHSVSDGVGLVRMTEGLIERSAEPDPAERSPLPELPMAIAPTEWERTRSAASHRARNRWSQATRAARALNGGLRALAKNPGQAIRQVTESASSVGRLLKPVSEPLSPVMRERSLSVRYEMLSVPFKELKRAAKAAGGTLNDAFVAGVTGGLRRYHEHLGAPVEELRMNMPINMRSGDKALDSGNQFAPVRFAVPISIENPAERMQHIHGLVAEQRAEPALPLIDPISAAIGSLPGSGAARLSGSMMKAIDFTTSNVPGPRFPVYVSGAKVEQMFGFGPLAGAAANVTCFSYDGAVDIGINCDPAAVEDPALLTECLVKGVDEVLSVS